MTDFSSNLDFSQARQLEASGKQSTKFPPVGPVELRIDIGSHNICEYFMRKQRKRKSRKIASGEKWLLQKQEEKNNWRMQSIWLWSEKTSDVDQKTFLFLQTLKFSKLKRFPISHSTPDIFIKVIEWYDVVNVRFLHGRDVPCKRNLRFVWFTCPKPGHLLASPHSSSISKPRSSRAFQLRRLAMRHWHTPHVKKALERNKTNKAFGCCL